MGVAGDYLEDSDALGRDVDIVVAQILGDIRRLCLQTPKVWSTMDCHPHNLVIALDSVK